MCVCWVMYGEWEGKWKENMAKRGENRFWEAFCPLHMHAITQAEMQARPQAEIPRPTPRCTLLPEGLHVMHIHGISFGDLIYTTPRVVC